MTPVGIQYSCYLVLQCLPPTSDHFHKHSGYKTAQFWHVAGCYQPYISQSLTNDILGENENRKHAALFISRTRYFQVSKSLSQSIIYSVIYSSIHWVPTMFQTSLGNTVQFCHPGLPPHSTLMYHFTKIWSRRLRRKPGREELSHARGQGHEETPYIQGERNASKMVGVARGHQRANTLKP